VETFLLQHEAVDKVAVIDAPDDKKGEGIKAFIVPKPEFSNKVAAGGIIDWAREGFHPIKFRGPSNSGTNCL
jgi:acyl-coenzyme A synthetase/AMP-(fatty) acid ligase